MVVEQQKGGKDSSTCLHFSLHSYSYYVVLYPINTVVWQIKQFYKETAHILFAIYEWSCGPCQELTVYQQSTKIYKALY